MLTNLPVPYDLLCDCELFEAFPPTILTLRAGGRFDSHFWTQSGAPSPYLAFRAPPAFKLYMVLKACPAFNPYLALRAPLSPLSTHIWHSERPPAFKLYMVLRACPAFNPYLAFR